MADLLGAIAAPVENIRDPGGFRRYAVVKVLCGGHHQETPRAPGQAGLTTQPVMRT